jgi:hypothetical protein
LRSPSRAIVAGTSSRRTIVASTSTAVASPTPSSLTIGSGLRAKLRKTTIMISAAAVIVRAVVARPSATLCRLSPVSR